MSVSSDIKPTHGAEGLDSDILHNCMRCGFCLPACPTYRHEPIESASPRGRIALMKAAHDGQIDLLQIAPALDLCLGCRACEAVCPAGVAYGTLIEQGRAAVASVRPTPKPVKLAYRYVLGTPGGIKLAGWLFWLGQVTGLRWLAQKTGLVRAIGGEGLAAMERAMPRPVPPWRRLSRKRMYSAVGKRNLRVGFFLGCMSDIAFYETNQNAIAVLTAAGCEVVVVPGQGCCGAVMAHAGEHEMALAQAKRNIEAFDRPGLDVVVNTAGGCGAALKEYAGHFRNDPAWAERAARFSSACRDFAELLAELPPLPLGELSGTITYQDSCHLRNGQKVIQQPRNLLKSIPGLRYVELPEADRCCGAAGTYAISQAAMSDQILDQKMERVKGTGAHTVVVVNPPCQLEMIEGVERAGLSDQVQVRHLADVLADSLRHGPQDVSTK